MDALLICAALAWESHPEISNANVSICLERLL